MCGIVGLITPFGTTTADDKWFSDALIADTIRGHHSTGAVFVGENTTDVIKEAVDGAAFVHLNSFNEKLKFRWWALIGHNRWATVGSVDKSTAHPFNHGQIFGVHNGTLPSHDHLKHASYEPLSDSDAIYYSMSIRGVKDTLKNIKGAATLVWYDGDSDTVNMVRNNERPLFLAESTNGKYYYASEEGMLTWLLKKHNINVKSIKQIEDNKMYSFKRVKHDLISSLVVKTYDVKVPDSYDNPDYLDMYYGYGSYRGNKNSLWSLGNNSIQQPYGSIKHKVYIDDAYPMPNGRYTLVGFSLSESTFEIEVPNVKKATAERFKDRTFSVTNKHRKYLRHDKKRATGVYEVQINHLSPVEDELSMLDASALEPCLSCGKYNHLVSGTQTCEQCLEDFENFGQYYAG